MKDISFPNTLAWPEIEVIELVKCAELYKTVYEDPGLWYYMLSRAELSRGTLLCGKRIEFYRVYLFILGSTLYDWSRGGLSVSFEGEIADKPFVKRLNEDPGRYDDILRGTVPRERSLKRFVLEKAFDLTIQSEKSLTDTMKFVNWFLRVAKIYCEDDQEKDDFVQAVISMAISTERHLAGMKWGAVFS